MLNGILTIPLGGRSSGSAAGAESLAHPLAEYVAGAENRLAEGALRALMDRESTCYSPLVLYGPHGAGKSHLARGLVTWWSQRYPQEPVGCLTAAEFAREHAAAVAQHRLEEWREEKHALALFVLEDLGQMAGKRTAQHELQHLLDALADREALVLVTARSLPGQSATLLPELRSRLSGGLVVPLSLPGPATRRAILERLASVRGLALSKRAIHSLADSLATNVPTLISALLELELEARATGQPVSSRRVREYLTQRDSAQRPNLRQIAALTAKHFGLSLADLKSPQRRQPLVAGRGVAMYLARQLTDKSFEQIGAFFGGRDHTTVLHGCRRTESLLARDRALRQAVAEVRRRLHAS
ncbi:MAG: DnaA/Hda family protein [Pirellulales bacterium]